MAVPKQKQSHARTAQRRAQHKVERAGVQRLPAVPQPPAAAPGVSGVRELQGPRGASPTPASSPTDARPMVTVAVDAGGADLGPAEVAAGAAARGRAGHRACSCSARPREIGTVADGVEVVDAPVSIAKAADPAFAVRSTPEASIVQAARAVAEGRAEALVSGGSTGSALAAGLFNMRRDRGIYRPALALPVPMPGGAPVLLLDVGANVTCRPEHLVQFAHMGSAFAQAVMGIESPRVALLSNGEEPAKGTPELVDRARAARR